MDYLTDHACMYLLNEGCVMVVSKEQILQDTVEKAIEWEMARIACGGELSPSSKVLCE